MGRDLRLNDTQKRIIEQLSGRPVEGNYIYLWQGGLLYCQLKVLAHTTDDLEIYGEVMEMVDTVDGYRDEGGEI